MGNVLISYCERAIFAFVLKSVGGEARLESNMLL